MKSYFCTIFIFSFLFINIGFAQDDQGGKCGSLKECMVVNGIESGACFTDEYCMSGAMPTDSENYSGTCVIPDGLPNGQCIPPSAGGNSGLVRGTKLRLTINNKGLISLLTNTKEDPCFKNNSREEDGDFSKSAPSFGKKPANTCNDLKKICPTKRDELSCKKINGCIYPIVRMGEGGSCVQESRCIPDEQRCPALYANRDLCCGGQWTKDIRTDKAGNLEWVCVLKNFPSPGQTYCVGKSQGCAVTPPPPPPPPPIISCCSNEKSFLVGKRKYCKLPSGKIANPIDQKYCPREGSGCCDTSNKKLVEMFNKLGCDASIYKTLESCVGVKIIANSCVYYHKTFAGDPNKNIFSGKPDVKYCKNEACELSDESCSPKDVKCPLDFPTCVQSGGSGNYKCSRGQC